MTVYALVPDLKVPIHTSAGNLASGYKLFVYLAGTSTKATTYTDSTGTVANTNPLVTNARGEFASGVYVAGGSYKLVLTTDTDSDPPNSPIWTADNVIPTNYVAGGVATASEWTDTGLTPTYISASSFSLTGNQTSNIHDGRRLRCTISGGTRYGTVVSSTFGAGITTVVLNIDAGGALDSSVSAIAYSFLAAINPSFPANVTPFETNGRLTLSTGTPVTTTDVTAATTIYFTPYKGAIISLYDGAATWMRFSFSEVSKAVPNTTSTMYDVFAYLNGAALDLDIVAWTNDTTRATALALQDGVLVKSGATARKYVGSFRTTTVAGQTEDSAAKRYLWNMYNRVPRRMRNTDATATWTYTTAAFRIANGATAPANCLDFVIGWPEDEVRATVLHSAANTSATIGLSTAIGLDGNTRSADCLNQQVSSSGVNQITPMSAEYHGYPGIGRHYLSWLEYSAASGTTTWRGSNATPIDINGISGTIFA